MDMRTVLEKVAPGTLQQAVKLGVSTGFISDLKSGRRPLSIAMAAKIEAAAPEVTGLVEHAVQRKVASAQ